MCLCFLDPFIFFNMSSKKGKKRSIDQVYVTVPESSSKKHMTPVVYAPYPSSYNPMLYSGSPSGFHNLSVGSSKSDKELKFVDVDLGSTSTSTTLATSGGSTKLLLNGLKLGTAAYNRLGNKVVMKSIYWSVAFGMHGNDLDPGTDIDNNNVPVRFMIVYDKQANGATFALSDLLSNVAGVDNNIARNIDVNSPNNLNNKDRFLVLCDKRFVLQTGGPSSRMIKKFKRCNLNVAYKSGATVGDITDIVTGSLYVIAYRDNDIAGVTDALPVVSMTGDIRIRYSDD